MLERLKGIAVIEFQHNDVVRHELVSRITRAYDERDSNQSELSLPAAPLRKRGLR